MIPHLGERLAQELSVLQSRVFNPGELSIWGLEPGNPPPASSLRAEPPISSQSAEPVIPRTCLADGGAADGDHAVPITRGWRDAQSDIRPSSTTL